MILYNTLTNDILQVSFKRANHDIPKFWDFLWDIFFEMSGDVTQR